MVLANPMYKHTYVSGQPYASDTHHPSSVGCIVAVFVAQGLCQDSVFPRLSCVVVLAIQSDR